MPVDGVEYISGICWWERYVFVFLCFQKTSLWTRPYTLPMSPHLPPLPQHGGVCVCVYVNATSRGEETLASPAYQGWLARVPLPLGAAVNKIKGATLTPPSAQARALRASASLAPGIAIQLVSGSVVQLQSLSSSSTVAGSVACGGGAYCPSPLPILSPSAGPTKKVEPANPSSALLPHRVPRLVN
jgi:hypothetical protein